MKLFESFLVPTIILVFGGISSYLTLPKITVHVFAINSSVLLNSDFNFKQIFPRMKKKTRFTIQLVEVKNFISREVIPILKKLTGYDAILLVIHNEDYRVVFNVYVNCQIPTIAELARNELKVLTSLACDVVQRNKSISLLLKRIDPHSLDIILFVPLRPCLDLQKVFGEKMRDKVLGEALKYVDVQATVQVKYVFYVLESKGSKQMQA